MAMRMQVNRRLKTRIFWMLCSTIPLLLLIAWQNFGPPTILNVTPSYPFGFWLIGDTPSAENIKGKYVAFCPPDIEVVRHFRSKDPHKPKGRCPGGFTTFIKKVVAIPGDVIYVGSEVYINDQLQAKSRVYRSYRSHLDHFYKCIRLASDQVWVMSDYHDLSFDSRYYGPIKIDSITGSAEPWLVWDAAARFDPWKKAESSSKSKNGLLSAKR